MKRTCLVLLLLLFIPAILFGQSFLITADRLFDGIDIHKNWGVVINGNRIVTVGPAQKLQSEADSVINLGDATLMPGMIEGHSHVLLYPYNESNWNDQVLKESPALRAIRGAEMAKRQLMAGFTTVRDLGSEGAGYADVAVKQSIERGITEGPRLLVAGPAMVATGSYGPKGFRPDMDVPLGAEEADGRDVVRVARDQIGKGADFIKVYADYRWGPDGEARPTFSVEELKLIVNTAASSGRDVVAHASTREGMRRAALAGVKTIEHGTAASMEILALMKEHNVALCPTLAATYAITQYRGWDDQKDPEPDAITEKRAFFDRVLKSGVTIVAGGDVGVFSHGDNARELILMNEWGMENLEVLRSVTSVNARVFGLEDRGQLKEGLLADIIAVAGDPSKEITALNDIFMVMKDGKIIIE